MSGRGELERLRTGVPGFDEISFGGLPAGRSALVSGTAGSGKTLLAVQFLVAGLEQGRSAVLVCIEERPEQIFRNVESLGWSLQHYVDGGRLAIVDLAATEGETIATGEFDFGALIARVEAAITRTKAERVAIDAIGALFGRFTGAPMVRRELSRLVERLTHTGATAIITADRPEEYGPVARFGVEDLVADTVIVLRNPLGKERRRRTIEILKLRGGGHERGEHPFGIDVHRGIVVSPLAALGADDEPAGGRLSTGVPTLDAMCAGGVPTGAITLVHGPSGAGKSLLACHFAQAGLDAGERVLLYSFEDSAPRLLRHAEAIGLGGLRAGMEAGRLSIIARYPERLGLEELLIEMQRDADRDRPARLVVDSLSVLDRVSSGAAFREFIVGLVTLLRAHRIAALCTHEVGREGASKTITDISTLAGCLVGLRYVERDGEHRRVVRIIKLEGSAHDHTEREYRIDGRGLALVAAGPAGPR